MTKLATPFNAVCFDCDSTLSRIEGIDELADRSGVIEDIAPLTRAAMEGGVDLDEIYGKRLDLVQPDQTAIDWLAQRYIDELVAGALETVTTLHQLKKSVHIISGGIRQAILPLADLLKIPHNNVHAVDIMFNTDGSYKGFETTSPLITPDGKATLCQKVIQSHGPTAMIGDGLTDVAARKAGAYVIGFGGVENRQIVADTADAFIETPDLTATFDLLLDDDERATLNRDAASKTNT